MGLLTVLMVLGIMMRWIEPLSPIIIVVVVAGFTIQNFLQSLRAGGPGGPH